MLSLECLGGIEVQLDSKRSGALAALLVLGAPVSRQHPSETPDYLLTRVLAYCLEYAEGIAFSKGLSDPDEPAIAVRDLTGALQVWVDVGLPEPDASEAVV